MDFTGHDPEQTALSHPDLSRGLDSVISRGAFLPRPASNSVGLCCAPIG